MGDCKYSISPCGLLKLLQMALLIAGFITTLLFSLEYCNVDNSENNSTGNGTLLPAIEKNETNGLFCQEEMFAGWIAFMVLSFVIFILDLIIFIVHLFIPGWMKLISSKIAAMELVYCIFAAIVTAAASATLAAQNGGETKLIASAVLGFVAMLAMLAECVFLYKFSKKGPL
ncbi:uncharacterized protein LOC117106498 isoform X2 [Anneissia japonica]|uniref:uncharacterized protein LOC117106498 isoform X2 n=1 Tax=Anneissia japonica TaxID=1529436 RepID=UPI001425879E|nr:uncharacterized protein LOC117106498 isoform X2 [Anneissia japonica]